MENVNWLKLKLDKNMMNLQSAKTSINVEPSKGDYAKNLIQQAQENIINQVQRQAVNPQVLRMNNLASIDRAIYIKNLLNLPKNMVELLVMVQNNGKMPTLQPLPINQPPNPINPNQQNFPPNPLNPQQNAVQPQPQVNPNGNNPVPVNQPNNNPTANLPQNINQGLPQNPQVQLPEQPQVQQQQRPRNDNELPYKQGNQSQQDRYDNLPQKQINADKEAFQQQINNAKQETLSQKAQQSLQTQNQTQLPQTQKQINQNIVQPQNQVRPTVPNNQPTARITQGQEFLQQPKEVVQPRPDAQQNISPQNIQNKPITNIQQPIQQQVVPPQIQKNGHEKINQTPKQDIQNHVINNAQNNISEKINNNINNIRQNVVQNNINENIQKTILNKPESILPNPKEIVNQPLRNPNVIRNQIRPMPLPPQIPNTEEIADELQTNTPKTQNMSPEQLAQFKQNLASQLSESVNLTNVSALLQRNSKMAMNKMVAMMTMATAQGMTDIKPLQDTVNIISASVSANSQNDSIQTLKNLMLLYLPWLPLQEGVGFDLDIEQDVTIPESDTFIKILITMVNYGSLNATVSLVSGNSVDIGIVCSEKFPKKELFRRLQKDSTQHSMQSVIDFQQQKPQEQIETINPKAKVNLSNVNKVNPYLLLMSHSIIRHAIEIDATISIGQQPIDE